MIDELKSKIKDLFNKGAFHIIAGNFINKFVGLCGSIFIVRLLSKEDYGTLGYIENLYTYVYILAGFGLSAALLRYNVIAKDREEAYGFFSFSIKRQTIINIALVAFAIVISLLYSHPIEYHKAAFLLPILLISIPFQDITNASLCNERTMFNNKRYVNLSIIVSVVSVVFRMIGSFVAGVEGTVVFRVIADSTTGIMLLILAYKKYFIGYSKKDPTREKKREISLYAFQNMVANGVWVLFIITDVLLIGRLGTGPEMLADYKVAYLLPSNMAIITGAITVFIGPYFVKYENNHEWVKENYKKVILVNVILVGSFALILAIFAKEIILLLYGQDYLSVVPLMRLLLAAHFINSCFKGVTGNLLATMGQAKHNMIISFIGFFSQVSMGIYVIPRFGLIGLAIGSIIVYAIMSSILVIVFARKYEFFKYK